ncbi:MAG: PKD domain-containing protein [Thermoplasmata archaeon]|nr:MAG: PKD domain-containing protein [Thermoplasmata archaeon]
MREEVTFTSLSADEDGTIVNFTWDFGDGNISYEENPVHIFEKKGTYNVTLTVIDNDGATHQTMLQVKVTKEEVNTLLYVAIIVALIIIAIIVVVVWKQRTKSS